MEPIDQSAQEFMFTVIENWKKSNQSQMRFCEEQGIAYHRFHYWYKKYNDQKRILSGASFSEVRIQGSGKARADIEVIYPDGRRIIFHQGVEATFLRHLLG